MFVMQQSSKDYELVYAECSRIIYTKQKEKEDKTKLWRELNDGMCWLRKGCKAEDFGILGVQVFGRRCI